MSYLTLVLPCALSGVLCAVIQVCPPKSRCWKHNPQGNSDGRRSLSRGSALRNALGRSLGQWTSYQRTRLVFHLRSGLHIRKGLVGARPMPGISPHSLLFNFHGNLKRTKSFKGSPEHSHKDTDNK